MGAENKAERLERDERGGESESNKGERANELQVVVVRSGSKRHRVLRRGLLASHTLQVGALLRLRTRRSRTDYALPN